jgi:DNA-binding NarL/FixJ family response regulator
MLTGQEIGGTCLHGDSMRVVIGEDESLYREGLIRLLTEAGYSVVAVAEAADELVRNVAGHRPDIVVTDVRMPPNQGDDGLRAAITIRERFPGTAVLVLSQYVAQRSAIELFGRSAEGVGYLLKDRVADLEQFVEAVRRVARGGSALDPAVVRNLLSGAHSDPLEELTPREREVLTLLAAGRSNRGVAEALVVTEDAVEKHVRSIFRKLEIPVSATDHRRVLAVLAFLDRAKRAG